MEGGIFKPTKDWAFARGIDIMNSKSSKTFRWSVRLTDNGGFFTGIASKLKGSNAWIDGYDKNSILFSLFESKIYKGLSKSFPSNITNVKSGDEVHFRFQPKLKKFSITFVGLIIFS